MPLSLAFHKLSHYSTATNSSLYNLDNHLPFPVYCEVSSNANAATCHSSFLSLLDESFTVENKSTFFYGVRDTDWLINSRHKAEYMVPINCDHCIYMPYLC